MCTQHTRDTFTGNTVLESRMGNLLLSAAMHTIIKCT